jgi:anti-sigma-K factor RskA
MSGPIDHCPRAADAPAFVLGALPDGDSFREHAESCAACSAELAKLGPAAELLTVAVPERRAPAAMNERIMARVNAEADLLRAAGPDADRPRRTARPGLFRPALAGAVLALVAVLAVVLASGGGGPRERTTLAQVAPGVSGAVAALKQSGSHAELVVARMPQAPLGKVYEVWLKRSDGAVQPTNALFSVTNTGGGMVDVPRLEHVTAVMVTSEPIGGSQHPTGPPLLVFKLGAGNA